jgi:cytochrome c peroxidase
MVLARTVLARTALARSVLARTALARAVLARTALARSVPARAVLAGAMLTGAVLAVGALVTAGAASGAQFLNPFATSLFPPNYTARVNRASIGRNNPHRMAHRPKDNNPMRFFAANTSRREASANLASLGETLFNDATLSNPVGQSCASCHSSEAAMTFPNSALNAAFGPVPGAVKNRFGFRLPPSVTYAVFSPPGPYYDASVQTYVGGQFWDGRALDQKAQAQFPEFNANEMNDITHNLKDPTLVMQKIEHGPSGDQFKRVYGANAFSASPDTTMARVGEAIAAFEQTRKVSPFTSKYDDYLTGKAKLSNSEMNGLRLFMGSATGRPGGPANYKDAKCAACHGIPEDPTTGPDLFSNFCFTNIGVPRNPANPFYRNTNGAANPLGFNPQGTAFVDLGLGDFLYPSFGLPSGNMGKGSTNQGDFLAINGTFKAPSLRNIDKRPYPGFVRAYMHNGVFKSLKDVVHFYNTRNLTTVPGEVIDFSKTNPYAGLKGRPLHDRPEYGSPDTLANPTGSVDEEVGNLGLTASEEADIVAFLKTLSDR